MQPFPPRLMDHVRDVALVVTFLGLTIGVAHGAYAVVDLVNAPGKVVCLNPAGVDDVKD